MALSKILNEEFSLSFGYPRTDTCVTCDELSAKISNAKGDEKIQLLASKEAHVAEGDLGYETLFRDTEKGRISWTGKSRTFGQLPLSVDATDVYTFDHEKMDSYQCKQRAS